MKSKKRIFEILLTLLGAGFVVFISDGLDLEKMRGWGAIEGAFLIFGPLLLGRYLGIAIDTIIYKNYDK